MLLLKFIDMLVISLQAQRGDYQGMHLLYMI